MTQFFVILFYLFNNLNIEVTNKIYLLLRKKLDDVNN